MLALYDGSLEGLLCAFAAVDQRDPELAEFTPVGQAQPTLWDDALRIATDPAQARAFLNQVRTRVSDAAAHHVLHCWCAEVAGLENDLFRYVTLGFRHGAAVDEMHADLAVHRTLLAAQRVGGEIHRFHGILRFREMADRSLYAPMAPDANIAPLVAWHFTRRLRAERWLIHDTRRGVGAFWNGHDLDVVTVDGLADPGGGMELRESAEEAFYQALWRRYFEVVAIPERRNPDLQRRFLPRRYWQYLVEMPQRKQVLPAGENQTVPGPLHDRRPRPST